MGERCNRDHLTLLRQGYGVASRVAKAEASLVAKLRRSGGDRRSVCIRVHQWPAFHIDGYEA